MTNQELNEIHKEYCRLEQELDKVKKERDDLKKKNQDLHKRWLIAVEFIHSLAVGFPMGFWARVQKASEVLKKINP